MTTRLLTPKDLADALGVSESSLKRWADDGSIRCSRTAGGHRRIALPEAIRFVRESRATLVRPEILGLPDVDAIAGSIPAEQDFTRQFTDYLLDGRAREARGMVMAAYLSGRSVAELLDLLVAPAMHHVGELWLHDSKGIFIEHRATDICIQAVNQLRAVLPAHEGGPFAVGAAPTNDPYLIPSLMSATVLASEGFNAINLGPETPVESLVHAVEQYDARLVWLSISNTEKTETISPYVTELLSALQNTTARLVVGGRSRSLVKVPAASRLIIVGSMTDLAAYARGLSVAA